MRTENLDKLFTNILTEELNKKSNLMVEKLSDKQSKYLDVAKPKGVLNKKDFQKLGNMKKKVTKEESEVCEQCGGQMDEGECMECGMGGIYEFDDIEVMKSEKKSKKEPTYVGKGLEDNKLMSSLRNKLSKMKKRIKMGEEETEEGNLFTDKLRKTKKGEKFKIGNKTYTDNSNLNEKWDGEVTVKKTGEHAGKTVQELKKELNLLKQKSKKIQETGKKVPKSIINQEAELKFAIRAKQGWKKGEGSMNESKGMLFTEDEIVDIIENVVKKEKSNIGKKKVATSSYLEKANNITKKEKDSYMKELGDKMKNYLKTGSKGKYEMNPEHFPKGNGELQKMDKKAFVPSKDVEEYIDNFTAAGLENLTFDEFHPNDKWMDDNIEGSSRTGNNPKWANAVDTGVNKKRNRVRKDNLLGAVKAMAYNKAPQPVVDAAKKGAAAKFQRNFGKNAGTKATKILNQLESTNEKTLTKLNEETSKMMNLINYSKKTQ